MFVMGLDIGYANLKLAVGAPGEEPTVLIRPAGAAPLGRLGERVARGGEGETAISVPVNGEPWAAAVDPGRFEGGWQRSLHAEYATTPAYQALFRAALVLAGREVITRLVTGLPVAQAQDASRREALRTALAGRHRVGPGRSVEVREVRVIAQPVGAFLELLWSRAPGELLERIEAGAVLVLDAGHFSVDWALIVRGELRRAASGTSLEAMSVLLERAARLIAAEHGGKPWAGALESALHAGRPHLLVLGQRVALRPYLERAAAEVATVALEALRESLRREAGNVDVVLLAGGGGQLYGARAEALFPGAAIVSLREPVAANARGFFRYAQG